MPEISQLAPALAASDDDAVPVSQAGIVRRVTRAQLLAGVQPGISLPTRTLLGRNSPGSGAPEPIRIGANLSLAAGVLDAGRPFSPANLPAGRAPVSTDLIALSQSGRDVAVAYGPFLAGLARLGGIDLSSHLVQVGSKPRSLAASFSDAMPVEAFGAVGDGITDDSAALDDALASGRPVLFGPRTYARRGQWTIASSAVLVGTPGRTRIRQLGRVGGAFVSVQGQDFAATGIAFDAGRIADGWCVLVTATTQSARFESCSFANAAGAVLGCGLAIQGPADPAAPQTQALLRGCEFLANQAHGLWIRAGVAATVEGCLAHDNGAYGLCADDNDPALLRRARRILFLGNRASANQRGIQVGNFNATNVEPPTYGAADLDADTCLVSGNLVHDNKAYGIAIAGRSVLVQGNLLSRNGADAPGGGGILAHAVQSQIAGNLVDGSAQYGIDAGGSSDTSVSDNHVTGHVVGINPGGSQRVRVEGNHLCGNTWGITVFNVETDGQGRTLGPPTDTLTLAANHITLAGPGGGGILLRDAPQHVLIAGNRFFGAPGAQPSQALWAHTDAVEIDGNTWDNMRRLPPMLVGTAPTQVLQVPDVIDEITLDAVPAAITGIVGQHAATVAGAIGFIKVTSPGQGYTTVSVRIEGSGAGASATGHLRDGRLVGIALVDPGSGYGASPVGVVVTGDGAGAVAAATVGLPPPVGRRLRIQCAGPVRFARTGSAPSLDNATLADLAIPAGSEVDWIATRSGWRAASFAAESFLNPLAQGSLLLRAPSGDLTLQPGAAGRLHIGSVAEPSGFVSALGRGSPENRISAPPGSDYRNLDGGVGQTLWLKRFGDGPTGWTAIA